MAANTPFDISKKSQEGLLEYHNQITTASNSQYNLREQFRQIDLAYLRENDNTAEHIRAKQANKNGNSDRLQNITIPVIKPMIDSAVDYQTAVFLQDYPLFGVVSDPQYIDQAMQLQAIIEENSIRSGWAREILLFLNKAFRYNIAALECTWDKAVTAAIETDLSYKGGQEGKPKQIVWQGNKLKSWDMYNTYFDTRCLPYDIASHGEYCGHTEVMGKTALKTFLNQLELKMIQNVVPALESSSMLLGSGYANDSCYYIPEINPDALVSSSDRNRMDWLNYVGMANGRNNNINYSNIYEVSTEYVRIMPSEFNIRAPAPNTPQVWKLIWVNHSVLVYAERQTNAHEKIPVLFAQPYEDGLGYQTKSLAQDGRPFQDVASALMNSVIAGRRRASTDRVLYDPSRVLEAHINNPNPSAKIPVRPSAYGKPVGEAVYPFPFRDDQAGIAMQEIQAVVSFGNVLNGQNPARQGQFVKGNKTDGQWETTMSNATSKDQRTAILLESQVFTPLKEILKINILQFQQAGTVYSPSQGKEVAIDPVELRKAVMNFKVTDGLTPKQKVISSEALKVGMQVIGSSPAIGQGYNVAPLFSYIMKTENVNLTPFEKTPNQLAYEQAANQWSQLAQLAIQKGAPFNIPQPLPKDFGYDPNMTNPQMAAASPGTANQGVQ